MLIALLRALQHQATVEIEPQRTRSASPVGSPSLPPFDHHNQHETGARPLTIDAAIRICNEYGVTLDWLYRDDRSRLPHHFAIEIARIEAAEP